MFDFPLIYYIDYNCGVKGPKLHIGPWILSEKVSNPKANKHYKMFWVNDFMNKAWIGKWSKLRRGQAQILMTKVTLQEASMTRTYPWNVQERRKPQEYLWESYGHCVKCPTATFLAVFMWRRLLNSVALATITHRGP